MTCPAAFFECFSLTAKTFGQGVFCNIVGTPVFGFWDSDLVNCGLKKLVCNLLELLIGSLEINLGDEQCFCWSLED